MLGLSSGLIYDNSSGSAFPNLLQATMSTTNAANLALWLKNNTGVTAAKWADSSGNNNHATQSTEGDQAVVSDGGLDFEESENDHYDLASTITINENQGFCFAAVVTTESSTVNSILGKDAFDLLSIKDTNAFRFRSDTSDVTTDIIFSNDGSTFPTSTKVLVLLNRSAGASNVFTFFKNGVQLTPDTDTSINEAEGENPGGFDLNILGTKDGSSQFFDGIIHEVAFWERSLTTQEIVDVNYYLKDIHGL